MKFKKYFEDFLKNRLVLNFLVTIILAVTEEIMELEFTCAPAPFNIVYFAIFLLAPAFTFSILNWIIQRYILNSIDVKNDSRWSKAWQSAFPFFMWFVVVFLDGRYFQCAFSTDHDASKKPTNIEMSAVSKMIGLLMLLIITSIMLVMYCCKKPQESIPKPDDSNNQGNQPSSGRNQSGEQPGDEGKGVPGPSDLEKGSVAEENGACRAT